MMAEEKPKYILCDLCEEEEATAFCDECQSKVCESCKKDHLKQKPTKDHTLVDINEVTLSDLKVSCSLCDGHAEKFCPICNLRLCTTCAESHHKLDFNTVDDKAGATGDRNQLLSKDSTPPPVYDELCDPCEAVSAVSFCKECQCKLGDVCEKSHKKQKLTRDNIIIPVQYTKRNSLNGRCSICNDRAGTLCAECDVQLCTFCSNSHHELRDTLATEMKIINTKQDFEKQFDESTEQPKESNSFKSGPLIDETSTGSSTLDPLSGQPIEGGKPGKPAVDKIYIDSVYILWAGVDNFGNGDVYQVRTENIIQTDKWHDLNFKVNNGKITGLEPGASYVFKVRLIKANGEASRYSDNSEKVTTHRSCASELVRTLSPVEANRKGPDLFTLPMHENEQGRDDKAMTRKYEIGQRTHENNERTIMLVGETGTGKCTLVDGLANYVMGVRLNDSFRFTLKNEEELEKKINQAISQTEWITTYSFNPQPGTRLSYRLNVIDTPGFADTRGPERDHKIVDQIRHLFEAPGEIGVQNIDAVGFLIKAPDSRLTATQTYIFNAIMSLFGKDIEKNICTLITFADGSDPPVLSAVNASGLPFGKMFTFNNSALFSNPSNDFISMFWEMGLQNFEEIFTHISSLETKSIQLTKEVLQERHRLEVTISNLQLNIKAGLAKIESFNSQIKLFVNNEEEIKNNQDFLYEVEDTKLIKVDLPAGVHVTNCIPCNRTCHDNCNISGNNQKRICSAIGSNGYCLHCPKKCYWDLHTNAPFKIEVTKEKHTKTYENMKAKYEQAKGKAMSFEQVIKAMENELLDINLVIESMLDDMRECNNRLKEIALRPSPLGMVEQIDILIQAEEYERKEGHGDRIKVLKTFRERADIGKFVNEFKSSLQQSVVEEKKKVFFFLHIWARFLPQVGILESTYEIT